MKTGYGFIAMTVDEFKSWLAKQTVSRAITRVQLHHTAAPDYAAWNKKPDALYWQNSMKNFHVNTNHYADIAQQFTICPDGTVVTGRSLNTAPAGITGANTGAICIENMGNFDSDSMTTAQSNAIVAVVGLLLKRFNLTTSAITYHAWWTYSGSGLGTYIAGKSAKTCPGLKFFGGNTKEAFNSNFKVKVQNYMSGNNVESGELTVTQYEELKQNISALTNTINAVKAELAEKTGYYNYIDKNMNDSYKPTIQKLVDKKYLRGNESGELMLTIDMMRILTILDRTGAFD